MPLSPYDLVEPLILVRWDKFNSPNEGGGRRIEINPKLDFGDS